MLSVPFRIKVRLNKSLTFWGLVRDRLPRGTDSSGSKVSGNLAVEGRLATSIKEDTGPHENMVLI